MRIGAWAGALATLVGNGVAAAPASPAVDAACPPIDATAGPGAVDPFRPPAPAATALNAAGKTLYRQGRWDEARASYRAAEAADPEFLAPALNVACSFVRQERFAEATAEVLRLIDRAYVPWSHEVLAAADLGALRPRPEMDRIHDALAAGARRWGAALENDLLFVARQREPLKLPVVGDAAKPVVLVLGLHQEVFAWSPISGRYRQITADDGRVLALAQSIDRRRIVYVTADKLVRNPAAPSTLRGVALHTLELPAMAARGTVALDGDVTRLAIVPTPAGFAVNVEGDRLQGGYRLTGAGDELISTQRPDDRRAGPRSIVLTAAGVTAGPARPLDGADRCRLVARPGPSEAGIATIEIVRAATGGVRRKSTTVPLILRARFGAGLGGLPIP